jgi:DNA-directed RNA polymerase subunit RPC12/RpoP
MSKIKYRCPHCGNTNLILAQETIIRKLFKMESDGNPRESPFITIDPYSDDVEEYLECPNCNNCCDFSDGAALKDWEND